MSEATPNHKSKPLKLLTLAGLLLGSLSGAQADDTLDRRLEQFAAESGITHWPRLSNCKLEATAPGTLVGLFLHVQLNGTYAQSHWDGRCRVPPSLHLPDWPKTRPDGLYVVAAQLVNEEGWDMARIVAIMPGEDPAYIPERVHQLQEAVFRQVCRHPPEGKETDRVCASLAARPENP